MAVLDFEQLEKVGKTVVYKSTNDNEQPTGWDYWGKRQTEKETVYVWRKIVTIDEANQYM